MLDRNKETKKKEIDAETDNLSGKILIVDDEPDILESVSDILQARGFDTRT